MSSLNPAVDDTEEVIAVLRETLRAVRFGSIEVVIHDGRVVQIDRKEKLRFQPGSEDRRPQVQGSRSR